MFHLRILGTKRRFLSPPFPRCEVFFNSSTDPNSTSFIFSFDIDSNLLSFSEDNSSCYFLSFSRTPCLQNKHLNLRKKKMSLSLVPIWVLYILQNGPLNTQPSCYITSNNYTIRMSNNQVYNDIQRSML